MLTGKTIRQYRRCDMCEISYNAVFYIFAWLIDNDEICICKDCAKRECGKTLQWKNREDLPVR